MASAFSDFYQCTIENLPNLRVIVFGTGRTMSNVFCQCPSLTIDNLPKLSTLHFGGQSFFAVETLQISNLPRLTEIRFGRGSICGHPEYGEEHGSLMFFDNQCIMENLPELKTLRCEGSDVGCYMGKLRFRNCSLSDLETDSGFFSNVWDLKCDHSLFTNYIQETSPLLDIFKPTDHFDHLQSDATEISLLSSEGNAEDVTRVDFSPFHNVRSIFIESNSLINVTSFTVKSLPFLRALSTDKQVCTKKGVAPSLSIEDCPALYKVHFHDRSFHGFTSFTLRACPKLQYLECGKRCFKRAREFHLKNLPALKRVKLESKSFMKASDVVLENLPSLTTMTLEDEALEGSPTIHDDVCVSYDGSLAMKNLPSLNKLCFGIKSFAYTGIVHLESRSGWTVSL